jgi:S-methylmethionine-dependent homocysteine/selenocysteine methylase
MGDEIFLTDSGIETYLMFQEGLALPKVAAFTVLKDASATAILRRYFERHVMIALAHGAGFIFESPTWRASTDWGTALGYDPRALADANRAAIHLMAELRDEFSGGRAPMVISGCVGPRGDGYAPGDLMSADQAADFHAHQVATFADTEADMISAITMTNVPEAIGVARAAAVADMPCAISFTVETNGRLPTGEPLSEAIDAVDMGTGGYPAYFMVNCAHPTHFDDALQNGEAWVARIRGVRANASTLSHAELDQATELDDGDPVALGRHYAALRRRLPQLTVLGGCCGTDHRHVEEIARACLRSSALAA